jgi:hypothetical protein
MAARHNALREIGEDIIVSSGCRGFIAVYYKPSQQPKLMLRHRTSSDDNELIASHVRDGPSIRTFTTP